jgi:alpha-1,6-mannosyltransferase
VNAAALPARRALTRLTAVPVALVLGAGVAIALAGAGTHGFLVPIEYRGVRAWIDGPLAPLGMAVSRTTFAGELVAMTAGYAALLALGDAIDERVVLVATGALYVLLGLAPPLLSTDVMSYVDYARLAAVHHLSPYRSAPWAAPHDVVFRFVHWRGTRSAYGPLFTAATWPLGLLSPVVALWVLKSAAALAGVACVALVWRIARHLGRSPAFAVAAFGLNPLVIVWTLGGGHNDMLMLAALLGGVLLVLERRELGAGAAVLVALGVKATAGLALPFALLGSRRRGRFAAGAALGSAAVAAVGYLAFTDHALGLVGVLHNERLLISQQSVAYGVLRLLGLQPDAHTRLALTALGGAALALLVLTAWRRRIDWIAAIGWALLAVVVTSTWTVPWYTIWALPFAAATRDRRLLAATLMLEASTLAYVVAGLVTA